MYARPLPWTRLHSVWPIASADGIICINMVHISPWEATLGLIKGAAAILPPAIAALSLRSIHTRRVRNGPEQPSIRPEPSRSQPELGSARPRSGCRDGAIRWILGSGYHRNARKQSERGVPPNVIVSLRGRSATERSLSKFRPGAWLLSQRVTAAPAAMTVCQKSAARNATTIIRRIRPRVSRAEACRRGRSAGRDRSCETTRSPASEPTSPDIDKDFLNPSFGSRPEHFAGSGDIARARKTPDGPSASRETQRLVVAGASRRH